MNTSFFLNVSRITGKGLPPCVLGICPNPSMQQRSYKSSYGFDFLNKSPCPEHFQLSSVWKSCQVRTPALQPSLHVSQGIELATAQWRKALEKTSRFAPSALLLHWTITGPENKSTPKKNVYCYCSHLAKVCLKQNSLAKNKTKNKQLKLLHDTIKAT